MPALKITYDPSADPKSKLKSKLHHGEELVRLSDGRVAKVRWNKTYGTYEQLAVYDIDREERSDRGTISDSDR